MKNIIICLLYAIFFIPILNAQTTAIPDNAFEQELITLGIDSDGILNGQMLTSDAIGVTSLTLLSGIVDLAGIEAFVDLDSLNCASTQLTSINLSANINIKYLYVSAGPVGPTGQLTTLDVSNNPLLEHLSCQFNNLTSLNLSNNPNLEYLSCWSNNLTSLDVSNNPNLEYLDCQFTNLTSLDLSNNPLLEYLSCQYNSLTSLDLSNNPLLVEILCQQNNLTSLDLSNNPNLVEIHCQQTNLTSLDLSNNPNLVILFCNNNIGLTSLDLSNNPLLEYLSCFSTNLTSLDLSNNPNLEHLSCWSNNLTSLDVSNNLNLEYLACWSTNLTGLDVSNNPNLVEIHCQSNNLISLDLSNNPNLVILFCSYNIGLTSLDLSNNPNLTSLYSGYNNLTSLDLSNNPLLVEIECPVNSLTSLDVSNSPLLESLSCSSNNIGHLCLMNNPALGNVQITNNLPQLGIGVQSVQAALNNINWVKDPTAIYTEGCYLLAIEGQVVIDDNLNCIADSLELGLLGQFIEFERITDAAVFYATTYDSLGNYKAYLDTGSYIASIVPNYPYWQGCPSSQTVVVDTNYTLQTIDWTLQAQVLCPMLEVDLSAPFLRMTGGGSSYTVSYCNNGTIAAQSAYVEVDIDADLNVLSSSIPPVSQNGTIYTYNIGNVGVGACGSFDIQVLVDTSALFEQTHCTEAYIYPDSSCLIPWVASQVGGHVTCLNDSVFFHLDNLGAAMLQPQGYSVIQDDIAMRTGTIQLTAGQSIIIAAAALEGSTYRILVDQLPGYPSILGDSIFTLAIEGCNPFPNNSFNTGFITQFSNGNSSPFVAVDCQQNIASYDPNDKAAQPEGYGPSHYIYQETAIDYKVRFQNTGTDTAFNILVTDIISPYLDITTLEMGASSHAYTWTIDNNNLLKVKFDDVLLVDSNANEPLSHGFFRYRIEQKANNPLGSVIENTAAIYFDYNPPIITNTTFHTIGENFVPMTVAIDKIYEEAIQITAFPNPFTHSTTIKVAGKEYDALHLSVFDISGRAVAEKEIGFNNQIELSRGNLQAGIYFYRLLGDGQLINTGKLIVQ